ncbi:MAG: YtxH domain-containing protein [Bacillota bacterium]
MLIADGGRGSDMRRFVQGMVTGGVLGALGVYLLTPDNTGTTMQRAGEKMEDMARRVQKKSTEMMDS